MKQPTTQKEAIRYHLEAYGHISSWIAIKEYGCTRLSQFILLLRKEGLRIDTLPTHRVNRFGNPVTYATYKLVEQKKISIFVGQSDVGNHNYLF